MAPKKMPKKNSTSRNQSMAVPSRHRAWPDRSSRRRAPSGGEAGHDLEHVVAVAVELRRPHALDAAQRPQIVRTGDGDVLQGGVAEDDEGRPALALGDLAAPAAQPLEPDAVLAPAGGSEIGRASCRERM